MTGLSILHALAERPLVDWYGRLAEDVHGIATALSVVASCPKCGSVFADEKVEPSKRAFYEATAELALALDAWKRGSCDCDAGVVLRWIENDPMRSGK